MAFTYFFRDMLTLELITKYVIPQVKGHRHIRVWDAGCAHGPEPYSVAIMFRENMSHFMFRNVKIYASDIDTSSRFGEIIVNGVYPEGEIKRIPSEIRKKYFSKNGRPGYYEISDEIKSCLTFTQHDLLSLTPVATDFNLIVCKNVLLHLKPKERVDVIKMYHDVLVPGGFFVTEQTQKMPMELESHFQQVVGNAQLFRKV
ncbi:MAG: chemotaxis protein CheR [Planctomycetota bacterium]|nr:MAG: chemotaxis protein CheR [Planctomycetota bacterium]